MASTAIIPLRARVLNENDIRRLAGRLEDRGAALAQDAPTLAGDMTASARVMHGLLDALHAAVSPDVAARLVAQIKIVEA
jgi:hypothetical protein